MDGVADELLISAASQMSGVQRREWYEHFRKSFAIQLFLKLSSRFVH